MSAAPHTAEERIVGLIARHQAELHRYVLSLLPDRMLADDVVQETNLVLWRKAADYDPAEPFLPWALTIAWYQVKAARRDAGRDRHVFDDSLVEILAAEHRVADPAEGDLERALDGCLRELPDRQRQLILARYAPGASVRELAAERKQSPTALSLALLRIRKALEQCVERKLAMS
ncbi:MAG: sigma-70 family RNA polymerase sigma factor [Verrucomicrobia bacterium]|nr:MAG: sigma-70 family RNA polymerase sigma factor [Verrucomicrobiota bacterium]TAE87844.1 MAG: sigma-70 family RNA polymerase sigma factor [Verrucomicrobiota bacterium]TAF25587.1 MAG: sigma-70 family RNA polymerase sigma factor [Verrucomicrobiota bacterium]TAF41346.1 MAG: sigma-70 family RNA polymerase sigma factor [Verrucomicrobiota bacterium]